MDFDFDAWWRKLRQQLEKYKSQAKKLADRMDNAGVDGGHVERFREDFGVVKPIDVGLTSKGGK
jgi:hypothetical protein